MIDATDLTSVGHVTKTHGIHGELMIELDYEGVELSSLRCVVFDMDGIYVPFYVKSERPRGTFGVLVMLDDVEDEAGASVFVGKTVYALAEEISDDDESEAGFYIDDLIGYELRDTDGSVVGEISDYDDSTTNTLLLVTDGVGDTIYIPMAVDLITDIDAGKKILTMDLPHGLLDK